MFHFFFVELRPFYFFYFSTRALINTQTVYAMSLFRDADANKWCKDPSCLESDAATESCLKRGVNEAMYSLDLNFENEALCTRFYDDNVLGYLHFTLLIIGSVGLIGIIRAFCNLKVKRFSFNTGAYLHFSKKLMENGLVKLCLISVLAYTIMLLIVVVLLPLTVLRKRLADQGIVVDWLFAKKWLNSALLSWSAVALSAYFLLFVDRTALDYQHIHTLDDVEFNRSWLDFFLETNSNLANKLERRMLRAKLEGNTEQLDELLVDSGKTGFLMEALNMSHAEDSNAQLLESLTSPGTL